MQFISSATFCAGNSEFKDKKKTFLYGDGYPQEFVNYIQESPFVVCEATKNDLKVLEAKHIPFVKIKK